MKPTVCFAAVLSIVLFSGGRAEAATVTQFYGDDAGSPYATTNSDATKAAFFSVIAPVTEDFEGFSEGQIGPLNVAFGVLNTFLSAGSPLSADYVFDLDQHAGEEHAAISPTTIFYHGDQQDVITIDFGISPKKAFGFYAGDVGDGAHSSDPDLVMELTYEDDSTEQLSIANGPGEQCWLYWGITSNVAFKSVSIWGDGGDAIWFDNMTASIVPEPSTLLLAAIGLLGFALYRRW